MNRKQGKAITRASSAGTDVAFKLLCRIAEVLVLAGTGSVEIGKLFNQAAKLADVKRRKIVSTAKFNWWGLARVITVWHHHPKFTDHLGAPKELTTVGSSSEFTSLISQALGRGSTRGILSALLEIGAIRKTIRSTVIPVERAIIIKQRKEVTLVRALQMLNALLSTIHSNVVRSRAKRPGQGLFERTAVSEKFDIRNLRALDSLVRAHGQSFLEMLDEWIARHEVPENARNRSRARVGVGIYLFVDQD